MALCENVIILLFAFLYLCKPYQLCGTSHIYF